jgi:hypothetical protein
MSYYFNVPTDIADKICATLNIMFLELSLCTTFPFHFVVKSSSGKTPTTLGCTKTGPAGVQSSKALENM